MCLEDPPHLRRETLRLALRVVGYLECSGSEEGAAGAAAVRIALGGNSSKGMTVSHPSIRVRLTTEFISLRGLDW